MVLVVCFWYSSSVSAVQSVPYKLNFQGRLSNASGTTLSGSYDVQLKLYTAVTGGTFVWGETRTAANGNAVTVTNGLFSVLIGEGTAVAGSSASLQAAVTANSALYLEVTVGVETLSPRSQFGSSAYAVNSDMLDGLDSAAFGQLSGTNSWTGGQTVNVASANAFQAKNGSTNLFNVDTTNSIITVGTTDTTGAVLVLDTKSDSGDPTGSSAVAGAMYYNSNAGKFRCYQAGAWADCITAAGGATLQTAYNASGTPATITTTAAKGVSIVAGAAPTAHLFSVNNSSFGTTTNDVNGIDVNYAGGAAGVEGAGVRVDVTPGGTTGGTWSGLRVVANATGPATGVTEYGIKLEGPSSPGVGQETATYVGTGWDIGADIQSGGLQLSAMTDPATPAANNIRVYAKSVAGRIMLKAKSASGVDYAYQPSLFQQQVTIATPGITATTITGLGNGIPVLTGTGAAATTTEAQGAMNRITSGTTAGTGAGVQTTTVGYYRGTGGTNADGFFYYARINFPETLASYNNTTTGMRFFAGLSSLTITGAASMVASDAPTGDYAGFQYSAVRDTGGNFQFITRNGATQTVVSTGVALAVLKTYDFTVYAAPGGSTVYWRIANLTDGTSTEGSTSTTLPTTTVAMRTGFAIAPLSTTARYLHWQRLYTESDR